MEIPGTENKDLFPKGKSFVVAERHMALLQGNRARVDMSETGLGILQKDEEVYIIGQEDFFTNQANATKSKARVVEVDPRTQSFVVEFLD